jgi:hypothetical protein
MTKKQAVDVILAGRRAAARVGKAFIVDWDKLGRLGGFSAAELDQIDAAVTEIEAAYLRVMDGLS